MTVIIPIEATGYHFDQCNIKNAWADGWNGAGVIVGMIDDGLEQKQLDSSRDMLALDYDIRMGDTNPVAESGDGHGTKVGNVLFAESDGTGAVGVAYGSEFGVIRIGYGANGSDTQSTAAVAMALNFFDVVNCSWGWSNTWGDWHPIGSSLFSLFSDATTKGRKGLGTIFVWAAGNNRSTGQDVNYHNYINSPYCAAVAGVDSSGNITYWSNPGVALLCCASGVSIQGAGSGTSFAAPIVTGVIALMLEANPKLSWADVLEIISLTSVKNDPNNLSWKTNAAGRHYSRDYGFGLIDGGAAVNLAIHWTPKTLKSVTYSGTDNISVPDDFIVHSIEIDAVPANNFILTSPAGTSTTIINTPDQLISSPTLLTDRSKFGESSKGIWKISPSVGSATITIRGRVATINTPPVQHKPIGDITMTNLNPIHVVLPSNVFVDPDGDALTITLTGANSAPLPAWMTFDAASLTIAGTPDSVGVFALQLVATDAGGLSTDAPFTLTVAHINRAPTVASPIADITVEV